LIFQFPTFLWHQQVVMVAVFYGNQCIQRIFNVQEHHGMIFNNVFQSAQLCKKDFLCSFTWFTNVIIFVIVLCGNQGIQRVFNVQEYYGSANLWKVQFSTMCCRVSTIL
jgi:hypothetical protein